MTAGSARGDVEETARGGIFAGLSVAFSIGELVAYLYLWPGSTYVGLVYLSLALSVILAGMIIAIPKGNYHRVLSLAIALLVVFTVVWLIALTLLAIHTVGL